MKCNFCHKKVNLTLQASDGDFLTNFFQGGKRICLDCLRRRL